MANPDITFASLKPQDIARFHRNVRKGEPDECWPWTQPGMFNHRGYGFFRIYFGGRSGGCKTFTAHRVAYFLHYGIDPQDRLVCHRCDNPPCCNPHHLFLGTGKDNAQDMLRKGRQGRKGDVCTLPPDPKAKTRGERCGRAKLTKEAVKEIRARYRKGGITQAELSAEYGVSPHLINLVVRRFIWRHVED